jgi:protein-S-isoprenylcysteine O-methyltransferase Ste14
MTISGVGPWIVISGIASAGLIVWFERATGVSLPLPAGWAPWAFWVGAFAAAAGVLLWLCSVVQVRRAFNAHRLVTTGVYRLCRNPLYGAFIVLVIPGIALLADNLLLLAISAAAFLVFKLLIGQEERYLAAEFGEEFERYRRSVAQLIPFLL